MKKLRILSRFFDAASVAYALFSGPLPEGETAKPPKKRFRRLIKVAAVVFVFGAVGVATTAAYLMLSGPRMRIQPKYLPYQAQMPPVPAGIMPVSLIQESALSDNPLPDTERTRATGRVYYGYYCAFCHGGPGEVVGPVGHSYVPAPTRLSLPRIQAMSDGQLYQAMLTGPGHEPVLDYVIDAHTRWYIVSYVRALGNQRP